MLNKIISSVVLIAILAAGSVNAQVTYIHEDFQGSVAAESNVIGQITKRVHYEPYGEQRTSTISNEAAHTGHVYDADLGLSYMGSRYYDPTIGRFYSNDPIGFISDAPASFNRYAYANNNPYAYTDPNGELPIFLIPVIVAIAKEVAATAAESYIESKTGVAVPLSTKSLVKGAAKQIGKQAVKQTGETGSKKAAAQATKRSKKTDPKETGSYTNTHASSKTYSGKGDKKRSQQSGRRQARANDDPHTSTDYTPAKNDREAFKQEARRIEKEGGVKSETNYNQVNSPGVKYRKQDGD